MSETIRWGIRGAGNISRQFARGLQALPDAQLLAIGSRTQQSADSFGEEFAIPKRYADYRAMAEDPDIDAIYIGTLHPFHKEESIFFLKAGKAVLCEKPFCINAAEAEELIAVARTEKTFLMEAMWTRFLPIVQEIKTWLADGRIGEVRMLTADFGFRCAPDEEGRLFDPAYGGGGLLDVGIYPIALASMIFGQQPSQIRSLAEIGPTGVDEQNAMIFAYPGGQLALLASALRTNTPQDAHIMGSNGEIHLHSPFWMGSRATLTIDGEDPQTIERPFTGNGYNYEAQEVMHCLRAGKPESDQMPLDESLALMKTMDTLRAQWNLRYPME